MLHKMWTIESIFEEVMGLWSSKCGDFCQIDATVIRWRHLKVQRTVSGSDIRRKVAFIGRNTFTIAAKLQLNYAVLKMMALSLEVPLHFSLQCDRWTSWNRVSWPRPGIRLILKRIQQLTKSSVVSSKYPNGNLCCVGYQLGNGRSYKTSKFRFDSSWRGYFRYAKVVWWEWTIGSRRSSIFSLALPLTGCKLTRKFLSPLLLFYQIIIWIFHIFTKTLCLG